MGKVPTNCTVEKCVVIFYFFSTLPTYWYSTHVSYRTGTVIPVNSFFGVFYCEKFSCYFEVSMFIGPSTVAIVKSLVSAADP